ncbi:MAG: PAS domain-containing protein [Aquabacterium sp.]
MPLTPPSADRVLALAQRALLDHALRNDPAHALTLLAAALSEALGCDCEIMAVTPAGAPAWQVTQRAAGPMQADTAPLVLPLARLGRAAGLLSLSLPAPHDARTWADALTPVIDAAATLLLVRAQPAGEGGAYTALVRAALQGADTFVWEWDIDSDVLGDIDEGFRLLGYRRGELGHLQGDWNALIHPDDRAANHEAYLRHAAGEVPIYEHAYRVRHRDGHWLWMLERGSIVERHADGRPRRMMGTQTDITGQRRAEDAADAATLRLLKLSSHTPGWLFQFQRWPDGRERYPYISDHAAQIGLDVAALSRFGGSTYWNVLPEDRAQVLREVNASDAAQRPWRMDFRLMTPAGPRWMRSEATPQREDDGSTLWHGYMHDITEERELERVRRDKLQAEASSRAKSDFLSRVSHELRTPLNAILGFAQLLQLGGTLGDQALRQVGLIREAGDHLLAMIGDLLDLTAIESGRLPLALEPVPLAPLADECLALVQQQGAALGLTMELDADPAAVVRADRRRLKQVLLNLLSNAIKYNRHGGFVRLRAAVAGHDATLDVEDGGGGLTEDQQRELFQPFNRLGQAHGPVAGTGIGLALSRSLVVVMDGRIEVHSRPGVGSRFRVVLPRAES